MPPRPFPFKQLRHTPGRSDMPTHVPGTPKGEEMIARKGREPGRPAGGYTTRTARDATSINPEAAEPIDPRMPHIPPS